MSDPVVSSASRVVAHRYMDPLDRIWLATARRIGLRVERSSEVYASTDGQGTLTIGQAHTLDADDCLAQMIFHELCHSLIEGPDAFSRPDWGLDNTGPRDVVREHACLRLQATLAAEHGLRRFLAPTTDFRVFYDALPDDPLMPRHWPSVTLAVAAARRASTPPWAPHLDTALRATAAIAGHAAHFADRSPRSPGQKHGLTLYAEVDLPAERHPLGFARNPDADKARTCATCAWHFCGGRGPAVDRCRQAGGVRVDPAWPACDRWEPALDCQDCGACCRAAYDSVTVSRRDPVMRRHPALIVDRGSYVELARVDCHGENRCAALQGGTFLQASDAAVPGTWQPYACAIYQDRPRPCREFENGGDHCLTARRRVGLSR